MKWPLPHLMMDPLLLNIPPHFSPCSALFSIFPAIVIIAIPLAIQSSTIHFLPNIEWHFAEQSVPSSTPFPSHYIFMQILGERLAYKLLNDKYRSSTYGPGLHSHLQHSKWSASSLQRQTISPKLSSGARPLAHPSAGPRILQVPFQSTLKSILPFSFAVIPF